MNVQLRRHNRSFTRENYTTERNETRPNKFGNFGPSYLTQQPKTATPNRSRLPGLNLSGTTPISKERSNKSLGMEHHSRGRTPSMNYTGEVRTKSQIGDENKAAGTIVLDNNQGNEVEELGEPSMPQIDVGKAMTLSYNQYLYHKLLEKERLKVARVKANQLEDEKRNTFRQKFLEKEKKKEMVLSNLLQNKIKRQKEIEEQRKDKQQKLEELEQIYFNKSRERFRSLITRIEKTDINKKELDMNKTLRITARNGLISSRQRARAEKEIQENSILLTQNSLSELENKHALNSARRKKHVEDKINRSQTYLRGVVEKGMQANQAKLNKQNEYLQKYAKKMDKARSRSAMVTPKGTEANEDYPEERERSGFGMRAEAVHQKNEEMEKKRLFDYKEKDRLLKERLEKRRLEIAAYVKEKRDDWDFKLGIVKQNARNNSVDYGEKTEHRMTTYKMRVNNLVANRIDKRNKLEKLGKTFTFESSSKSNLFITGTEPSKLR